jgi:hypothetical protein
MLIDVTIPESVTTLGLGVFSGCTSLKQVHIPQNVSLIGPNAFTTCSSLQKVTFAPNSTLLSIGFGAFSQTALINIELPVRLSQVEEYETNGSLLFRDVSTIRSISMNRSIWDKVCTSLSNNIDRYVYFHTEQVVYINRTNQKEDLQVDASGIGRSFFKAFSYRRTPVGGGSGSGPVGGGGSGPVGGGGSGPVGGGGPVGGSGGGITTDSTTWFNKNKIWVIPVSIIGFFVVIGIAIKFKGV